MDKKSYLTIALRGEAEFIEKRSRFIGAAIPIENEQQALDFISERRSLYWNATHNVYAYSLKDGSIRRFSDDSEPQGTAGMPTLDVLQKSEVTDVCVVTTRYFGGILLGAGGLVRAYSHAASIALDAAGIVRMIPVYICTISCDYHIYGKLNTTLLAEGGLDVNADFTDAVNIKFSFPMNDLNRLQKIITEITNGKVSIDIIGEKYTAVKI